MKKTQKLIIIVTIIIFLLTLMFPMCYPRTSSSRTERGFHFLLDVPTSKAIDVRVLLLSWILLASFAGIAYYLARPNSEIRRLIHKRAFRRVVFWLSVIFVVVGLIFLAVVTVDEFYLQPKREARRSAQQAAQWAAQEPARRAQYAAKRNAEMERTLAGLIDRGWGEDDLSPKQYKLVFWHKAARDNGYTAEQILAAYYETGTLSLHQMAWNRTLPPHDREKSMLALKNGYSRQQILAAFCKAHPVDTHTSEQLQTFKNSYGTDKNINTSLTLDEMAAKKRW